MMRSRSVRWLASLSAAVSLLPGCDATENTIPETTLAAATTATPATTTTIVPSTTASETTTAAPTAIPATQNDTEPALAPIGATWSYLGTVDDWLTEPVMVDGRYYATRKGLDEDLQVVDGQVEGEGVIEDGGELWTSLDGVTWMIAEEGEQPPPAAPDTQAEGAAVVVRRHPIGDQYGVLVAEGLWATTDGTSWREIPLRPSQDNWIPSVATGGLGWIVYSPPREATVEADASSLFQGPRHENLGLWYTPDTEEWFEVTDLGPLADVVGDTAEHDGEIIVVVDDGEVGVMGAAMIVRDTDILVYVNIATSSGWVIGDPHTEIWRLQLSPWVPAEAFDFSTQSLCDWFSPNDIDAIVTSTYEAVGVPLNAGGEMNQRQDQNSDCFWYEPLVTLSEYDAAFTWDGGPFEPHSALDDSILVSIRAPGSYGLMHGVDALLKVEGHAEPLWFGHSTGTLRDDVETINTLGLTIANKMLQQMGWIESP
jgi:hypothetical protein